MPLHRANSAVTRISEIFRANSSLTPISELYRVTDANALELVYTAFKPFDNRYTSGTHTFIVPRGITEILISGRGADGGGGGGGAGQGDNLGRVLSVTEGGGIGGPGGTGGPGADGGRDSNGRRSSTSATGAGGGGGEAGQTLPDMIITIDGRTLFTARSGRGGDGGVGGGSGGRAGIAVGGTTSTQRALNGGAGGLRSLAFGGDERTSGSAGGAGLGGYFGEEIGERKFTVTPGQVITITIPTGTGAHGNAGRGGTGWNYFYRDNDNVRVNASTSGGRLGTDGTDGITAGWARIRSVGNTGTVPPTPDPDPTPVDPPPTRPYSHQFTITSLAATFGQTGQPGFVTGRSEGSVDSSESSFRTPDGETRTINGLFLLSGTTNIRISLDSGTPNNQFPDRIVCTRAGNTITFANPSNYAARGLGQQADYARSTGVTNPTVVLLLGNSVEVELFWD